MEIESIFPELFVALDKEIESGSVSVSKTEFTHFSVNSSETRYVKRIYGVNFKFVEELDGEAIFSQSNPMNFIDLEILVCKGQTDSLIVFVSQKFSHNSREVTRTYDLFSWESDD